MTVTAITERLSWRPRLATALFVFHLVAIAALYHGAWFSGALHAIDFAFFSPHHLRFHITESFGVSQIFLIALWAGLGPERTSVRLLSCSALAVLLWLAVTAAWETFANGAFLWRNVSSLAMGLALTLVLLLIRYAPGMRLRLAVADGVGVDEQRLRRPSSVTRALLVLTLVWAVVVATAEHLRLEPPESEFAGPYLAYACKQLAIHVGFFVLISVSLLLLTLTAFADRFLLRHWWAVGCGIALAGGSLAITFFHDEWQELRYYEWLQTIAVLMLNLLVLRMAGFRLRTSSPDGGASNWSRLPGLPSCHVAALLATGLLVALGWWPGIVDDLQLWLHCNVERDPGGRIVELSVNKPHPSVLRRLSTFKHLRKLEVSYTVLSDRDVALIARATSVDSLNLEGSIFDGHGLQHIAAMPGLRRLDLSNGQFEPRRLAHLKDVPLVSLALADVGLEDEQVKLLNQLHVRQLSLSGNPISNVGLQHLQLFELDELFLGDTQVTDASTDHLNRFQGLRVLALDGTGVSDAGLAKLQNVEQLEKLYLEQTQVTSASFAQLSRRTRLKFLTLDGGTWTNAQSAELQQALPNCMIWDPYDKLAFGADEGTQ